MLLLALQVSGENVWRFEKMMNLLRFVDDLNHRSLQGQEKSRSTQGSGYEPVFKGTLVEWSPSVGECWRILRSAVLSERNINELRLPDGEDD